MTLLLDAASIDAAFDWNAAIDALRQAYDAPDEAARFPARGMARGDHGWMRTLSGAPANAEMMGLKVISVSGTARQGTMLIALFKQESAELYALLDGYGITGYRTAATSALAADLLLGSESPSVAVIGSGFEAKNHLRAFAKIRAISDARVYSPNPDSREKFVSELQDVSTPISASGSAAEAVAGADLVICAARSRDESPTLLGEWLEPGMTVVSIGSTLPEQREVDSAVIDRSSLIVADVVDEVIEDTGDFIAAREAGVDAAGRVVSLADLVGGRSPGRTNDSDIVLYKSVGASLQDLTVAELCLKRAQEKGLGIEGPDFLRLLS